MCRFQAIFEMVEDFWVEGSSTTSLAGDFFNSLTFRRQARVYQLAPGLMAYVEPAERPRVLIMVAEVDQPVNGQRVAGLDFYNLSCFRRGQTFFRRRVVCVHPMVESIIGGRCMI